MVACGPQRILSPARPLTPAALERIARHLAGETHAARELDRGASKRNGVRIHSTFDYDA
jgi:hypothetical protein